MVTLTAFNVQRILGVYPERLPDVLPKVFEQLQDENLEEMALHNYVVRFYQTPTTIFFHASQRSSR